MISKQVLIRLNEMLATLLTQAKHIDEQNQLDKAFAFRRNNALFSESLFSSNSEFLVPYVNETQAKVKELEQLLQQKKHQFSFERLQSVEHQVSALINAIKSNQTLNKTSATQFQANQQRKYKLAAKSLLAPTQSLHQKLAETFEFERRLQAMLDEKQSQLSRAADKDKHTITEQLLVLHQRLGRCRQAISKLERQIEMSEKR